jgi:feruloyl esterase
MNALPCRSIITGLVIATISVTQPVSASGDTVQACAGLAQQTLSGMRVESSEAITDRQDLPGFCAVRGSIAPSIGFEMRLPLSNWNGKLFQSGCGGYCGSVLPDKPGWSNTINGALQKGYAAITSDAGHQGGLGDASWAENNPQAVLLYAHQSIPLVNAAAQTLVDAFYSNKATRNYFGGCSNGGRMGAVAAQRYPQLFDGIFAGGSVLNLSQNGGIYGSWVVQSNTDSNQQRIITASNFAHKLPLLKGQVLTQCDLSDGVADNAISLPRACTVDLSLLPLCDDTRIEANESCFTAAEIGVLQRWYAGPSDSAGRQLYPGMPAGSEAYWLVWFLDPPGVTAPGNALGGDYARYLGFPEGVPEGYTALDFNFDLDPVRLETQGQMLNGLNPNLEEFRKAGGKLLMWHGWQDPLVLPDQSVAYYESVESSMGGQEAVQEFMRLFMIPGQGHCWELPADLPDQFDPLAALERWVEDGQAPDQLLLTKPHTAGEPADSMASAVVCPYPIDSNSCSR